MTLSPWTTLGRGGCATQPRTRAALSPGMPGQHVAGTLEAGLAGSRRVRRLRPHPAGDDSLTSIRAGDGQSAFRSNNLTPMTIESWIAFLLATAVMLAIPGPTILLVIGQSLGVGRRNALPLVAGVALGDLTAITLSLAGLGALLATSSLAFTALKWAGAAYLVYLGVKLWRAPVSAEATPPLEAGAAFR